ncbi:hypothetical protein NKDENANG_01067 [Candidatus Entotheonellaceae bacterium PAL068K]
MRIAREAQRRGREILLHLPMESHGYPDIDPGQPVLLSTMSADELTLRIRTALQALAAVGGQQSYGLAAHRKPCSHADRHAATEAPQPLLSG